MVQKGKKLELLNKKIVQMGNKIISADKNIIPSNKKIVQMNIKIIPAYKNIIPSNKKIVQMGNKIIPAYKNIIPSNKKIISGDNFRLKIFQEINKSNIGKNIMVSPLSIYHILSLTSNGAPNKTLIEMVQALSEKNITELNKNNKIIS